MSKIKALVVGVSNYYIGANDLPFCINDITAMESALHNGLKLEKNDVITCGQLGDVMVDDFKNALSQLTSLTNDSDILIFYFSGHGTTIDDKHYLVFSNGIISTQEVIDYFENIPTRSKIIFLDCCHSGNYSVSGTSEFSIEKTVAEFHGQGYAVLSSSNSHQYSYGHPDKPISVFTSFLCDALQHKQLIKEGKVTLHDIQKLVSLYLDVWNKRNPKKEQHPIFRANIGGTVFFDVEEYEPFYTSRIYAEYDKYIIYEVDPVHTGIAKRYSVKVILKEPLSLEEIGDISTKIKDTVRTAEVFTNEISQDRWSGELANIVCIYFGRDESDMISGNFICHTTWVDDKQDKDWWYRVDNKDTFMLNGIHFNIHSYYEHIKIFRNENTGNKNEVVLKTKEILAHSLTLAEKVIWLYNEYKNEIFTEEELIEKIEVIIPEIEKYYFLSGDLDIAPDELYDWHQACIGLFGTIHDFTLFYNKKNMEQRTPENRKTCMEMTIKQYYSDLEAIKKLEEVND
ncbi:caspase family protein [Bacillus sp. SRB_331]|uniref:caspase family protein n=1 Tax=Bacillus sp. SRB_331 TaxID=1969379 RepID=UPI000DC5CEDB|nr:caspase family protein [Bacillus sp. SRB_331]RAN85245.1 caspase [Bacillus sp. SRB_331]